MRSRAEFLRRAVAIGQLARVHNGAIAATGVVVGAWWANPRWPGTATALAGAAAFALAAFANAVNDWCDIDVDRVAHPNRPLPSGELPRVSAIVVAACSGVAGVVLSAAVDVELGVISIAVLALMVLYSTHIKRHGLAGNVVVAILASLPFLYGAWSVGAPEAALPLLIIAAPLHFAREVAKDLDDMSGDRGSRSTLPIVVGERRARAVFAFAVAVFLIALAPLVAHMHILAPLVAPAVLLCLAAVVRVTRGHPGGATLLKTAMVCAMISLLAVRP